MNDSLEPHPVTYRVLEPLAAGGMGQVDLAERLVAGAAAELVALKRLVPSLVEREDFCSLLIEEARVLSHLRHPNVVRLVDSGWARERFFVVMEYVDGPSLSTLLASLPRDERQLPLGLAVYVATQTARALEYIHTACDASGKPLWLIHRDVAPANVLLSREGEVKLTDFGIAKSSSSRLATTPGIIKGKLGYMSPEQALGMPVDDRTDVFSLGVLLWEATLSRRLFMCNSGGQLVYAAQMARPPRPRDVDPNYPTELEAIVLAALAHDRAERIGSAAELRARLDAFLSTWPDAAGAPELGALVTAHAPPRPVYETIQLRLAPAAPRPIGTGLHAPRGSLADTGSVTLVQANASDPQVDAAPVDAPAAREAAAHPVEAPASRALATTDQAPASPRNRRGALDTTSGLARALGRRPRALVVAASLAALAMLLSAAVPRGTSEAANSPARTAVAADAGPPLPAPPAPSLTPPSTPNVEASDPGGPVDAGVPVRPRLGGELRIVTPRGDAIRTIQIDGRRTPCRAEPGGDLICGVRAGRRGLSLELARGGSIERRVRVHPDESTTCRLVGDPRRVRCDDHDPIGVAP